MVGRAGQASAWPVPSDAGIATPVRSATHNRVATAGDGSLISSRSIRKMRYPPFTQGLRLGLCCLSSASALEVRHD
ncbi:ash family protein [Pseudomonas sp. sp1636]|uniref:ash family protein n=1 Tax=Pseudomonas sp. sp1636 TaxID=3036707 RepID=UPI0035B68BF7